MFTQIRTERRGLYWAGVGILFVVMLTAGALFKLLPAGTLPVDPRPLFTDRLLLPLWMVTFTGLIEGLAVVLLVIPRLRFWGAALIVGIMAGALFFQFRAALYQWTLIVDGLLLIVSFLVAWFSRPPILFGSDDVDSAGGPSSQPAASGA